MAKDQRDPGPASPLILLDIDLEIVYSEDAFIPR